MTKDLALHHNPHQPRWLNMTMDQVMQSAEAQREVAGAGG
jgi:hypothetical protein